MIGPPAPLCAGSRCAAGVMQLFQAQMLLQDVYGGIIELPARLTPAQLQVASRAWRATTRHTTTSSFQEDITRVLRDMGTQPQVGMDQSMQATCTACITVLKSM